MPLNCKSSRTTWVKSCEWDLALSARGAKSVTAMRGFSRPNPVPVCTQSCAKAVAPEHRNRTIANSTAHGKNRSFTFASRIIFFAAQSPVHFHLVRPGRQKVKRNRNIQARIVCWEGRHGIRVVQCSQAGSVERRVAAGQRDVNVAHAPVTIDCKRGSGMDGARGSRGRINARLYPVLRNPPPDRFHICRVAPREIASGGAAHLHTIGRRSRSLLVTGGRV